jgi:hypothetical protein
MEIYQLVQKLLWRTHTQTAWWPKKPHFPYLWKYGNNTELMVWKAKRREPKGRYIQRKKEKFWKELIVHVDGDRLCLWTAATNRPIIHPAGDIAWSMDSNGGIILTGEKRRPLRKTCPSATSSIWTEPGANPGLRGERPANNRLSHGWWTQNLLNKVMLAPTVVRIPHYATPSLCLALSQEVWGQTDQRQRIQS